MAIASPGGNAMASWVVRGAAVVALLVAPWLGLVRYARFDDDWAWAYRYYSCAPQSAVEAGFEGFLVGGIIGAFLGALAGAGVGGIVQAIRPTR